MKDPFDNNRYYPLIIWVLTILSTPITWMIYRLISKGGRVLSWIETLPVFYIVGFIYSIPTLAIFILVFELLKKKSISDIFLKVLLSTFGVTGIFLTLWYIGGKMSMELAIFYCINMTFFIWYVKMKRMSTSTQINVYNNQTM